MFELVYSEQFGEPRSTDFYILVEEGKGYATGDYEFYQHEIPAHLRIYFTLRGGNNYDYYPMTGFSILLIEKDMTWEEVREKYENKT